MKHSLNSHQRRNHILILWALASGLGGSRQSRLGSSFKWPAARETMAVALVTLADPERKRSGRGFYFLFFARTGGVCGHNFGGCLMSLHQQGVYLAGLSIYGNAHDISPSCVYKWKKIQFCNASYTVYSSAPSIFFPLLQLYERPYNASGTILSQPRRCPLRKKNRYYIGDSQHLRCLVAFVTLCTISECARWSREHGGAKWLKLTTHVTLYHDGSKPHPCFNSLSLVRKESSILYEEDRYFKAVLRHSGGTTMTDSIA